MFIFSGRADMVILIAGEVATDAPENGLPPAIERLFEYGTDLILDLANRDTSGTEPLKPDGLGVRLAYHYSLTIGLYTTAGITTGIVGSRGIE
jgi:hypothetical protein